ncbi:type II secretion system protein [Adhaeretor mobilis]|uniref:Type II secretion system protein n=1 Tax=Adhaeretor mobilis TaxID=1930276 RepID=A0A517MT10_9BACT|nr:prepilin-type N-terminal cleavage/methylation domain-containing protein [Adhaeretor mobilis]QDS98024.1 hypothetical protein HG15A2_12940 [Adhaeretor mobilis]
MSNSPTKNRRPAFTLTELLVVISIIAVLASLITAGAVNALNAAKRARIKLEIKEIERSLLTFKEDFGTFPPNAITNNGATPSLTQVRSDVTRAIKNWFSRANEPNELLEKLIGNPSAPTPSGSSAMNQGGYLENGLSGAEAIVLWLSGFSDDEQRPFTGPGGPSYVPANGAEVLESRNFLYEFDVTRFGPRDDNGNFSGRFVEYEDSNGATRRINLWTYTPADSEQPYVYFDTSKLKPSEMLPKYDFELASRSDTSISGTGGTVIRPIRRRLETATGTITDYSQTKFVNQGTFQVLHAGLDDAWGETNDWNGFAGAEPGLLFPEGPFTGDIADTLTNFTQDTLEAEQE